MFLINKMVKIKMPTISFNVWLYIIIGACVIASFITAHMSGSHGISCLFIIVFMMAASAATTYIVLEPKFAKPNPYLLSGSPGGACLKGDACNIGSTCDKTLKLCHPVKIHTTAAAIAEANSLLNNKLNQIKL